MKLWEPLSSTYQATLRSLHQIAFFAVSPARQDAVGRMGLRPTPGGFGTPPFDGRIARVEGDLLVLETGETTATRTITTVREAAEFFNGEYRAVWYPDFHDPLDPVDPDLELEVNPGDVDLIAAWFRFGFDVLDRVRETGTPSDDVSEAQIWPEHFDAAIEMGSADKGERASFGFSPGDDAHDQPYVYVAPWGDAPAGDYWNDQVFAGASVGYRQLSDSGDPAGLAEEFLRRGHEVLHGD